MRRAGRARLLAAAVSAVSAVAVAFIAALAVAGVLLGTAGTARAATAAGAGAAARALSMHAALASTEPADGSVVNAEPQQVSASFDEAIGVSANSLEVYGPGGQRADNGQSLHPSSYEVAVGLLPGLGKGTYTAVWHVISADTHPVEGAFTFSIGAPSATHVSALLPASDPVAGEVFAVVRWLEYAFFALLGGGIAFLISCWPAGGTRRGVGRLITVSSLGLLLSTLAGLLLQGPYSAGTGLGQVFSGALVSSTLHSSLGPASEAREVLSLLAAGFASFLLPRLPAVTRRGRRAAGAVWAVLISGLAATWAVADHASTGVQTPWGIPDDIIHLDAVALWIGGLAVLAGFALRGAAPATLSLDSAVARAVPRFSAIALGCVLTIVASGTYQTWREAGAWDALFDTSYGRLILAKIAGLLVLIALGYLARRYIQRGLSPAALLAVPAVPAVAVTVGTGTGQAGADRNARDAGDARDARDARDDRGRADSAEGAAGGAGRARTGRRHGRAGRGAPGVPGVPCGGNPAGPGPSFGPAMRKLRRSVAVELGVAAVILALTAVLVNTATGREAYAPTVNASQGFNTGGPGGTGTVHVFVGPAQLGPNTIEVYFTAPDGKALLPAQVTAALYFPAKDLGPLPVTLAKTAPGQYRAADAVVTFTGQWSLQIIVRSDAFDETSVSIPVEVH